MLLFHFFLARAHCFLIKELENEIRNVELFDGEFEPSEKSVPFVDKNLAGEQRYFDEQQIHLLQGSREEGPLDVKELAKKQFEKEKKHVVLHAEQRDSLQFFRWVNEGIEGTKAVKRKDKNKQAGFRNIFMESDEIFTTDGQDVSDDDEEGYEFEYL